jgi:hypothetical protein
MKEVAKMLSSLEKCLAKRLNNKSICIDFSLTGESTFGLIANCVVTIKCWDGNNIVFSKYIFIEISEKTNYVTFYKIILKEIYE